MPAFFLLWFAIALGPLLPLGRHIAAYYLFIPAIGMALLGADALVRAWKSGWGARGIAMLAALLYVVPSTAAARAGMRFYFDRAERVRMLVQSVAYVKRIHPGKMVLLDRVDDGLFWSGVYDYPFRGLGGGDVLLAPGCRARIRDTPGRTPVDTFIVPERATLRALHDGTALVYEVEDGGLRNVTRRYAALSELRPPPGLAAALNVGSQYLDDQIGEGWFPIDHGIRWSGKHAVVYLRGPAGAGQKLTLQGWVGDEVMKAGPIHVAVTIAGQPEPIKTIDAKRTNAFALVYDLAPDLCGRPKIEIAFTVDHTTRPPGDWRDLGLAFGEFLIQ